MPRLLALVLTLTLAAPAAPVLGQGTGYALLVGGLGGTPDHTETFSGYLLDTRRALVERHGFEAANVTVLGEPAVADAAHVDGASTAEEIRAAFARLAERAGPDDHVLVVLYGHGSFDGTHAALNIPRRDLRDDDYAALVDGLGAGRVVFVNTASASGPFAAALAGDERVVLTATRTGTQRNETRFPRYFVEALAAPGADADRDGRLSAREAFVYAARAVEASFEAEGSLATEHALLQDTPSGEALRLETLGDGGALAGVTYFARRAEGAGSGEGLAERETLERAIAELTSEKAALGEDDYYARLETLFVRLARLNARLER